MMQFETVDASIENSRSYKGKKPYQFPLECISVIVPYTTTPGQQQDDLGEMYIHPLLDLWLASTRPS